MKILIGCEESGIIATAFRMAGYEAYSCDILPTRGNKDWHMKMDIMDAIPEKKWDLIILHPDCTAMAVSGNRWYGTGKPDYDKRKKAISWTCMLWEKAVSICNHVALENPVSVIFQYLDYHDLQYIHPWQFGHGEQKKTGLALKNLPRLRPTKIVDGREQRIWKMSPSETRKRDRSQTYQGIADAIADQWGDAIMKNYKSELF